MVRHYTILDKICLQIDHVLQTFIVFNQVSDRINPAEKIPEVELNESERKHVAALMRVNHVGEVCAQALYQGQAFTARFPDVSQKMKVASQEEQDHLIWCKQRITELGGHTSYLNPLWYAGAFIIGAVAGAVGDRWSLGFVMETEKQVVHHLQNHLSRLAPEDKKTKALLEQMVRDEAKHEKEAFHAGAISLPLSIRSLMQVISKVMTTIAYWV